MPLPPGPSTVIPTTDPAMVKRLERQNRALTLRKEGWSIGDIAAELGVAEGTAREDIKSAIAQIQWNNAEMVAEIRQGILDRNMDMIRSLYEKILVGDVNAQDRVIRINQQLMDLVIGQKLDVTSGGEKLAEPIRHVEVFLAASEPVRNDHLIEGGRIEVTHGD